MAPALAPSGRPAAVAALRVSPLVARSVPPSSASSSRPSARAVSRAHVGVHVGAPCARDPVSGSSRACGRAARAARASSAASAVAPVLSVQIDNSSDPFATVVRVEYGSLASDADLLQLVSSIKALGLHVKRAKLRGSGDVHTFFVTDGVGEKVLKSAQIEEARLAILDVFERLHPGADGAGAGPGAGAGGPGSGGAGSVTARDLTHPLGKARLGLRTSVEVRDTPGGRFSELLVNTTDRPGLLTDIVRVLKDVNLNVVSAEVDTVGHNAFDRFNVTYHGEPLAEPMQLLAVNALQYYLSQSEVEKGWCESY